MNENIYIEFGKRLSALRNSKGISQNDISSQLGIAQTTYSGYEKGVRKIPLEVITSLSNILDVSPTYLINGTLPTSENHSANTAFSSEELNHIKKYRSLNENGKLKLDDYLDDLLSSSRNVYCEPSKSNSTHIPDIEKITQEALAFKRAMSKAQLKK